MSTPFTSTHPCPRSPKVRKINKRHRDCKERSKIALTENMIIYIGKFKKSPKTQFDLISEFNKIIGNVSIQKLLY